MYNECDFSEKCPHCGTKDDECLTEINGYFSTGNADRGDQVVQIHLYHCRNCGVVFGSDS